MKDMQQHEEDMEGSEMMMMNEVKEESRNFAENSPDQAPPPHHHHLPLVEEMEIPETDSIFYGDDFPSLPDFACITSSSSSSSAFPPTRTSSTSSVSTAWAVVKAEREESGDLLLPENHPGMEDLPPPPLEGMDVLGELGNLGLLDDTEIWDPATLFPDEEAENFLQGDGGNNDQSQEMVAVEGESEGVKKAAEEKQPSEDLAMVFFEWLKTNKDSISPEDLRSIKLKRSTIECAAKRLGGGKEGMMQLLKLILAWVQNHHLQKKKNKAEELNPTPFQYQNTAPPYPQFPVQAPLQIPSQNPNPNVDSWVHPSPQAPPFPPMMMGYVGPGPTSAMTRNFPPPPPPPPPHDYRNAMIDPNAAWAAHYAHYGGRYGDHPPPAHPPSQAGYMGFGSNYGVTQLYNGERFVRMASSATKEARKKRMARQRRFYTHHHHRHHNQHHSRLSGDGSCTQGGGAGNWVLFPTAAAPPPFGTTQQMILPDGGSPLSSVTHVDSTAIQMQQQQRHISSDRRQIYKRREFFHQYLQGGWKPEKNLRFLLQKVLKQSDVGNLGRIVLPKKEAETHLPELDARDGISIPMEDIGSSRIWNMRYRYWPNNKSRMYLLENTGDFVRSNGLQEGDFIVIYSDAKCTKYMIRGVKVRKPELKPEGKPPGKARKITTLHANPTGDDATVPS